MGNHNRTKGEHAEYMRRWRAGEIAPRRTTEVRKEQIREGSTLYAPLQMPAWRMQIDNAPAHGLRVAVIPDAQVKPGTPVEHLRAAGNYIADKRPEVVVCIGDFADMASLSLHSDRGSSEMEGKRYADDILAAQNAMAELMRPIHAAPNYDPILVMTLGNHEDRITRAINANPRQLEGLISLADLRYEELGWKVSPFLQPVIIGGVAFCHYFPSGKMGSPVQTPAGIIQKLHMSAFAGHQQGRQIAYAKRADGADMTAIISGSFYLHDEEYLSPFTNRHWRGMWMLNEARDGEFDEMALSVNYLLRKWA